MRLRRARSFTLDGGAVVYGPDGIAIFDALHRRGTVSEAMLYAFDLLELDGEDLCTLPLGDRKKRLARLLGKRRIGIVIGEHTDEDGAMISRQACKLALSASCRSGSTRRTGRGPRGIGSRSRIRTAGLWRDIARTAGKCAIERRGRLAIY
jgi:bifunctional non-homologous end joining protein LigD